MIYEVPFPVLALGWRRTLAGTGRFSLKGSGLMTI